MNKAFIVVIIVALIAVGMYVFVSRQSTQTTPQETETTAIPEEQTVNPTTENISTPTAEGVYTLEEIAQHGTPDDCWFAVKNTVYNVTEFVAGGKHPGGEAVAQGCGKDATELFTTRPMGSGTDHSEKAYGFLEKYKIGTLSQ